MKQEFRIEGPLSSELLQARRPRGGERHVVALGTFDGVHRGHQAILDAAQEKARTLDQQSADIDLPRTAVTCFTFDRLPLEIVGPERAPARLNSPETRYHRLLQAGADHIVIARFDETFARIPADRFVTDILLKSLGAAAIVIGFDHTFGHRGEGNGRFLEEMAGRHGIDVVQVRPVELDGEAVSSSKIRELLAEGDCLQARQLLGYAFVLEGTVVQGEGRGRTLGYPTANVQPLERSVIPADGVYLSAFSRPSGEPLGFGVTIISEKPTFNHQRRTIEGHIFDFDGDLYGETLRIAFLEHLRGIVRFESPDQLLQQMAQDVAEARRRLTADESEVGLSFTLRGTM